MTSAADRGHEVRQRLIRAAGELVVERGWTAVTTRVLADRAGVTPGLVHYHFRSVQAVLVRSAVEAAGALVAGLGAELAGARGAEETVTVLLGAADEHTGTDPASVLLFEAYLAATRDEHLRRALGEVLGDLRGHLAGVLAARAVPAPEATAAVLLAALDGLLLHRALVPDAGDVAPVLRRLLPDSGVDRR